MEAALASEEAGRIAAVRRYDILDSPPDGAFDRICALAVRIFDVPIATVTIVDEDRIWFKAHAGLDVVEIPRVPGLCASAILQDDAYVISDGLTDPRVASNALVHGELGVRFYAAAPITTSDGYRLGTVNVIGSTPRAVTDAEMQTLRDLAAIVMDELELRLAAMRELRSQREALRAALEQQRHAEQLTQTLQRSLSPPTLPEVPGLQTAVHYQPYAGAGVGGDFYDVFPLDAKRWGFFLGDVCGKGPEAASVTSLARYTLRAAAMHDGGPADVLRDLNTALRMQGAGDMCTVAYGEIDSAGGGLTIALAVAGHPAPLVVRADGTVTPATARGTILGAVSDVDFASCRIELLPGDAIVLYSDGLLDVQIDGARVEEEWVGHLLRSATTTAAGALIDRVTDTLQRLEQPLRDDVAIVALSRPIA
ncbi:MAG: phosphoserine phosphatase RsbU/P [Solirubrobacteraceae bacterium]|jgi:sigma-B regulation protein RsbU (phosphoserine phosphatase)|nr:phosphoserine phosphatase RsbU/P [Solirubrobacteraceae bacterium]